MSNEIPCSKLQTNEEILEELTKDLESCSVQNVTPSTNSEHHIKEAPPDRTNNILEENDENESEEKCNEPNDLNDYVDEEELKSLSTTLTDEEKLQRHADALILKTKGNTAHRDGEYLDAVQHYTSALRLCPVDSQIDRAVLYCNRAASKIQLKYNKSAIDDCNKAIEFNPNYVRAYLRRAKLFEDADKLDESLEDYKKVLEHDPGNPDALKASVKLPPLITERNEKLKTEMLGKLKDLGNMILKPFGLSTNNFQLQQDPTSGGYSINFQQNQK